MPGQRWLYRSEDALGMTFGGRIEWMKSLVGARGHRPTNAQLGAAIAELLERPEPVDQNTVSQWTRDTNIPSLDTVHAMADVLGCEPGWLAFGVRRETAYQLDRDTKLPTSVAFHETKHAVTVRSAARDVSPPHRSRLKRKKLPKVGDAPRRRKAS